MTRVITLIPGDGIGLEVSKATKQVIEALGLDIHFDVVNAGLTTLESFNELIPQSVYDSILEHKVAIKGPITTPIGHGFSSVNVHLRKTFDLYANIRPIQSLDQSIDMVIFRENTEGLYIGDETWEDDETVVAKKRVTKNGCRRIIKAAFEYAVNNHRSKVTCVHKANILKQTDGLFLSVFRDISTEYSIETEEVIIDAMCMKMVMDPTQFDVIVTMNLYGDILSDLGAGLVGGLGLIPGANIGSSVAIFEAVHGSAPDIAGKGIANPIALLKSAVLMLQYLDEYKAASCLDNGIQKLLKEQTFLTPDLGGVATTDELTNKLIEYLKE